MISEKLQRARDFEARYGAYIPDGEQAASMVIYSPLSAQSVSFEVVEGAAYIDVEHYSLNFGQEDAE